MITLRSLRPRWRWLVQSLQGRFATITALSVALSVLALGAASYTLTQRAMQDQMDSELLGVAMVTSSPISQDVVGLGGLNTSALSAANSILVLLRSDGAVTRVPGTSATITPGDLEMSIARTQIGYSTRTMKASDGGEYRVVAVPLSIEGDGHGYALVLARATEPTITTLTLLRNLVMALSLFFVGTAAALGYQSGRSVVRPLRELSAAVSHVTETDELVPVGIRSDNELGELSRGFNTMMHSLESSRDRQKRLIADAGHELRTPLTSMRTNVELLVADEKTGMLPEGARREILEDIAAQLGEFSSLVGDLMQLSRDDVVMPSPEPLDFASVVESAVTRAERRGPTLTFDVSLQPHFIVGEPDTLERAVTNLLDNAVKFSPEGGTVHVTMAEGTLTIADEGPGIADEDLPHIFDRFYRSNKARNTPGTGLGLSIVAHTVNAHGGWVKADHASSGGALFTMWLPEAPEEALAELDADA